MLTSMEIYQCPMLEKGESKMAIGKFLKGIGKDLKKGLKGSNPAGNEVGTGMYKEGGKVK